MSKSSNPKADPLYTYWEKEITAANKRLETFRQGGETAIDTYRQEKDNYKNLNSRDTYNILYSSTETMRPNLYAQRPKVRTKLRQKDTTNPAVRLAARMLESTLEAAIEDQDFDDIMDNVVEDLILPGLGQVWLRYEPKLQNIIDENTGAPVTDAEGNPLQELVDESVVIEHVYWSDFLFGRGRSWKTVPWVGRALHKNKAETEKRFGKKIADSLTYSERKNDNSYGGDDDKDSEYGLACYYEIWDKTSRRVIWVSLDKKIILDQRNDPLSLKGFFPCPRPLRAVSNTRTFVPKSYYSQYKAQHDTLNLLTGRIRLLTEAIKVVGVYDGSQESLANLLAPSNSNRMIAVQSWAAFAQAGGIKGQVEFLPIEQVVASLIQLLAARETCKNEIYEITGFSDIVRGVSKASETLGAQNIKANWASARLKRIQKDVQRFARDTIAIAGEIIAEHCEPQTILRYAGVDIPAPQAIETDPRAQQAWQQVEEAVRLLKTEPERVAVIDIETDSTLLADEEAERKDRMDFLGAAGAFLQQAVPAMEKTPELGPLLGAMLMFTVRTFPTSRPIEEEFEKVQSALAQRPQQQQQQNPEAARVQAATAVANVKAQTDEKRIAADTDLARTELDVKRSIEQEKINVQIQQERNRHAEKMEELRIKQQEIEIRRREVAVKEAELLVKQQDADTRADAAENAASVAEHGAMMKEVDADQEYERMDREHEAREQEREAPDQEGLTSGED